MTDFLKDHIKEYSFDYLDDSDGEFIAVKLCNSCFDHFGVPEKYINELEKSFGLVSCKVMGCRNDAEVSVRFDRVFYLKFDDGHVFTFRDVTEAEALELADHYLSENHLCTAKLYFEHMPRYVSRFYDSENVYNDEGTKDIYINGEYVGFFDTWYDYNT